MFIMYTKDKTPFWTNDSILARATGGDDEKKAE
jgi:hypothetical protein